LFKNDGQKNVTVEIDKDGNETHHVHYHHYHGGEIKNNEGKLLFKNEFELPCGPNPETPDFEVAVKRLGKKTFRQSYMSVG